MKSNNSSRILGIFAALMGASLWGFSGTCVQYMTAFTVIPLPPSLVTAMRIVVASALFLVTLFVTQRDVLKDMFSSGKTVLYLFVFGVGLFGSQFTFACSVDATNAGTATVLQMLSTVFVMLYVCVRGKKPPRLIELVGLLLALAATILIATQGNASTLSLPVTGLIWGIVNGVAVALYIIAPKELGLFQRYGSFASAGVAMMLSCPIAIIVCFAQAAMGVNMIEPLQALNPEGWLVLLGGVAFLGTFFAFALYIHGVSVAGSVAGSLLGAMEPVMASVCSTVWLGTIFTGFDWAGLVLMILMLVCVTVPAKSE